MSNNSTRSQHNTRHYDLSQRFLAKQERLKIPKTLERFVKDNSGTILDFKSDYTVVQISYEGYCIVSNWYLDFFKSTDCPSKLLEGIKTEADVKQMLNNHLEEYPVDAAIDQFGEGYEYGPHTLITKSLDTFNPTGDFVNYVAETHAPTTAVYEYTRTDGHPWIKPDPDWKDNGWFPASNAAVEFNWHDIPTEFTERDFVRGKCVDERLIVSDLAMQNLLNRASAVAIQSFIAQPQRVLVKN